MAITVTVQGLPVVPGATFKKNVVVALDAAYPNPAGYVLTPQTFGFNLLKFLVFAGFTTIAAGAYEAVLIPTWSADGSSLVSVALHVIVGSTGVEVANAVSLATSSLLFVVEGN